MTWYFKMRMASLTKTYSASDQGAYFVWTGLCLDSHHGVYIVGSRPRTRSETRYLAEDKTKYIRSSSQKVVSGNPNVE